MLTKISVIISNQQNSKAGDFTALAFDHEDKRVLDHIQLQFEATPKSSPKATIVNFTDYGLHADPVTRHKLLKFFHKFSKRDSIHFFVNGSAPRSLADLSTQWTYEKELSLATLALALFDKEKFKKIKQECVFKATDSFDLIKHSTMTTDTKYSLLSCMLEAWILDACYDQIKSKV